MNFWYLWSYKLGFCILKDKIIQLLFFKKTWYEVGKTP